MNTGKASDGDHQKPAWRENNRALVGGFINREKPRLSTRDESRRLAAGSSPVTPSPVW